MPYSVVRGTFESLGDSWAELLHASATDTIYTTLCWQRLWWEHFHSDQELVLLAIYRDSQMIGIAPLTKNGPLVSFIGSMEVCDYLDFILPEEHCSGGLSAVFDYLDDLSWSALALHSLPGGSPSLPVLREIAESRGYAVAIQQEDVCPRVDLPQDWESYLSGLSKKDRHELRRKFRRLERAGVFRDCPGEHGTNLERDLDDFFRLLRLGGHDKVDFMTAEMEAFFRSFMTALIPRGTGKLCFLEVENIRAAAIFFFDYNGDRLLYNSGFDPQFSSLSVGLLLKAYSLQDAIGAGKRRYDFLRGNEPYKYDLGGIDHPIYECAIRRG